MRILATFFLALAASAQPASKLWSDWKAARESLAGLHQEFDVSQTYKSAFGVQTSVRQVTIDIAGKKWRERSGNGPGSRVRMFDGQELVEIEEGGEEFVRNKRRPKDEEPTPAAYPGSTVDWSKAREVGRQPCGFPQNDRTCVTLEAPLKLWARDLGPIGMSRLTQGTARVIVDPATGQVMALHTVENLQSKHGSLDEPTSYLSDTRYVLTRTNYGNPLDSGLFILPAGMREVKQLSRSDAARIRKQLLGKPAPDLAVVDIAGKPLSLSSLKGRTVLLDFWATWCGPCRADAPSIDKLFKKYGDRELTIIGFSLGEDRKTVEDFLKSHPHGFSTVLTAENTIPPIFQVSAIPTYIVIDKDGTVAAAVEGDQGFSELKALLKKAGLEVDF